MSTSSHGVTGALSWAALSWSALSAGRGPQRHRHTYGYQPRNQQPTHHGMNHRCSNYEPPVHPARGNLQAAHPA